MLSLTKHLMRSNPLKSIALLKPQQRVSTIFTSSTFTIIDWKPHPNAPVDIGRFRFIFEPDILDELHVPFHEYIPGSPQSLMLQRKLALAMIEGSYGPMKFTNIHIQRQPDGSYIVKAFFPNVIEQISSESNKRKIRKVSNGRKKLSSVPKLKS